MTQHQDLDVLQHGATARRRGFGFQIFGIEVVTFTRKEESTETVLCTTGWRGISVLISGQAMLTRWHCGEIAEGGVPILMANRSQDFTSYALQSQRVRFLTLRLGRKVSRSRMVEMVGDQVSAQVIEEIALDRGLDYHQVVVSDGREGDGAGINTTSTLRQP
ncbi:hypothetical protein SJI00_20970 [Pseudomonas sp. RP23018S]|uniref:hypothetical protein n=1 Tax=Pseudomonas sp. RP23018S TaxID=3096037 RepID=UPI002ACA3512|nr:hypothetical protein [Pseudomonas sp. RP23018S]MDZ5605249.1 hypothetical protein [Pseudomonas sp. RP23018S]